MLLTVGRVIRPHGIRGEVVVEVRTDEPDQRYALGERLLAGPAGGDPSSDSREVISVASREFRVAAVRRHQDRLIVAFEGIADREAAERLRGVVLQVDSATVAAPADPEEFLDHQLIGLAVVDQAGEPVGEVIGIDHAPAGDLLVVRRPDAGSALVPFVAAIVPQVDLANRRVVIDPPAGLLDL